MFELYFSPRAVERLQGSPDAAILEGFLVRLHRRGHAGITIQRYVHAVEVFLCRLRKRRISLGGVDERFVRGFACERSPGGLPRGTVHAALRHLLRHLRDERPLPPSTRGGSTAVESLVAEYDSYLDGTCGLAVATRSYRQRYAREFVQSLFGSGRIDWRRLRPQHVRSFVADYGCNGRVAAAAVAAVSLRSFLRWLQVQDRIAGGLVEAVPRPRRWRLATLPAVMTDEQRRTFLAVFDRSRPCGCRDYAMAACMVDLGLRVSEVAGLLLDDLNEEMGTLRLTAGKGRRDRVLPMPRRVLEPVAEYVHQGRPETQDRHLFVRHRVPAGTGVSRELVRGVMRRIYAKVPGCETWTGTHPLRHTAATRLQRAGADLKRIADVLGHRSIDTTAIYAKVDLDRLTATALPWPGAEEVQP